MKSIDQRRTRLVKKGDKQPGPVVYWMSRDQRRDDNWALIFAQQTALKEKRPLMVVFCLVPEFLSATIRQYGFMLKGLEQLEQELTKKNISFICLCGEPEKEIPHYVNKNKSSVLVTDFDPLQIKRKWKDALKKKITIPFYEVDAHNLVPCWLASDKQEFGAYTIRPKIHRVLNEYLQDFPKVQKHPHSASPATTKTKWKSLGKKLCINRAVKEVSWINPGEKKALKMLKEFIHKKLNHYDDQRNDPNQDGQSDLSPYLHFGQLSAQRVALSVMAAKVNEQSKQAFLEELIVRRELSDNFCYYNKDYDSTDGFPQWAKKTIKTHAKDKRAFLYSLNQMESAQTHDDLWNAAQMEMVKTGKMHGYMRMYWAKKILEWTSSVKQAMKAAIFLNDKYELDGRDPNGYAGIAWSIGGVHDRAWGERAVFGKIRYMSYHGCQSKFDIKKYIKRNQPSH